MNKVCSNNSINWLKYNIFRTTNNIHMCEERNNYINKTILFNYYIIKKIIILLLNKRMRRLMRKKKEDVSKAKEI